MASGGIQLNIDQRAMQAVAKRIKEEANGKALRKDLMKELKSAAEPAASAVKAAVAGASAGSSRQSPSLSSYLSSRVKVGVRLSGRNTGVRIYIGQTPKLRGFAFAARRLNRETWKHQVFGKGEVTQRSPIPGFFDRTLMDKKPEYRKAVIESLEKMARRVAH